MKEKSKKGKILYEKYTKKNTHTGHKVRVGCFEDFKSLLGLRDIEEKMSLI
jgi:hypothetical protein